MNHTNSNNDVFGKLYNEWFQVLRDDILGKEYVVPAYIDLHVNYSLGFGNPQNKEVKVNIEFPTVDNYSRNLCKNETKEITIKAFQYEVLKLQCDIIGTRVNASENIIVYSLITKGVGELPDLLMIEQLIPVRLWGSFYVMVPSGKSPKGDIILIITAHDNTKVHILGYDHVTIPDKYGRIHRRILGTSPITIKTSDPVSVTQFVVRDDDSSMINIIPLKYKIDKNDLWEGDSNVRYTYIHEKKENAMTIPLSKYHAYQGNGISTVPEFVLGCSLLFKESKLLPRSNCGFMNESKTEDIWPVMVPGDGVDNDSDDKVDEDDCYKPDMFGTLFVIPVIQISGNLTCFISGYDGNEVIISYSMDKTVKWKAVTLTKNRNVFDVTVAADYPLIVKSDKRILLSCQYQCNSNTKCSNKFIVPPVDILQHEYFATIPFTALPETVSQKECLVAGIFNNTYFTIPEREQPWPLNKNRHQPIRDMTYNGTFITSSHIISVLCFIKYGTTTSEQYLVNQLLPVSGTRYNLKSSDILSEEKLVLISTDDNTVLNLKLTRIDQNNREKVYSEHVLIEKGGEIKNFSWENTTSLKLKIISNKPIIVMASFKRENQDESYSNRYDYVHVAPAQSTDVYRSLDQMESEMSNLIITKRIYPLTSYQIPGDGQDNDGDGLVDEEYCGFLWNDKRLVDYDLDGSLNEDCKGCPEGKELLSTFLCETCKIGTYRENLSRIDKCEKCGVNMTTFSHGSKSETDCFPICEEGMELENETKKCRPCPVGYYKDVSADETNRSVSDRFWCKKCSDEKTTYDTGTKSKNNCIAHCEKGKYLKDSDCSPCKIGFSKNTSSEDDTLDKNLRWNCTKCPDGKTTYSEGKHKCIEVCSEGREYNESTEKCDPCKLGFFKNISGSNVSCFPCPKNFTTRHLGATSGAQCKSANCRCPCDRVHKPKNYTNEELAKVIEEMKKELFINVKQLSSNIRKKISVKDNRPSSQSIGSLGIVMITMVFAVIIVFDFMILKEHISMFLRNVRYILTRH
ncbi:uncharacterized protein LOC133190656 [Saccostrea echinata]|uniref:uncharacterized protein LOC133190656 n=1 Tax=Saccostrea echinata TaxID=191078 RepID=UPI002A82E2BC|nr:uncharacterized protein LOC133190656 [Saccostrea echinata]